jgi:hypothetical protein
MAVAALVVAAGLGTGVAVAVALPISNWYAPKSRAGFSLVDATRPSVGLVGITWQGVGLEAAQANRGRGRVMLLQVGGGPGFCRP